MRRTCEKTRARFVFYSETYLYRSENFLYGQLRGMTYADVEVVARWGANLAEFPTDKLFLAEEFRKPLVRLKNAVVRRLLKFEPCRWRLPPYVVSRIARHLRRDPPELIYCMFGWQAAQIIDVLDRVGGRLAYFAGGSDVTSARTMGDDYLARLKEVWGRARLILSGSGFLKGKLLELGAPEEKIVVHYAGVNIPEVVGVERKPDRGFRILAVSRLSPVKGVPLTIRAFAKVAEVIPHATLTVVGDGEDRAKCEELVEKLGLLDRVVFAGSLPHGQVYQHMSRADVFVQHNVRTGEGQEESVAGTVSEASAHQLPIVGTKSGGVPEAVIDGRTGILVEPGDVDGMAEAIVRLYRDPALREEMGKAGRALVEEKFNLDKQNRMLEKLLFEAAGLVYPG